MRIIQMTDLHLFGHDRGELKGVNTAASFQQVLTAAQQYSQQTDLDYLLLTGDLSQDDSIESYQRLLAALESWPTPIAYIPGNHDQPELMQAILGAAWGERSVIDGEAWRIVLLNSQVPGAVHGELASDELAKLEAALATSQGRNVMLVLHHHVQHVNSPWIDEIGLQNSNDLLACIRRYENVRLVLSGHVHQESLTDSQGVTFMTTPSTCVQFRQLSVSMEIDTLAPGFRVVELQDDGQFQSSVIRI